MKYIKGQDRNQITLYPISLDSVIEPDNEIRIIYAFVEQLELEKFGFHLQHVENGRPAYHSSELLKL